MFVFPHGLYVDKDDNVWVTDGQGKDGKGQQVFKFSPDGKVLLTLGKAGVAGDGPDTFNQPSAVIVAPNGAIFVADGHGGNTNARIVKFDKDGKFIKAFGQHGSGPGDFSVPHCLAFNVRRLFACDRGNNRIRSSTRMENSSTSGRNSAGLAGAIDKRGMIYVVDSQVNDEIIPAGSAA